MKTIQLYDDCLTLMIPDSFVEMNAEEKIKRFSASALPTFCCIDREANSVISVLRTSQTVTDDALLQRISAYQQGYSRMAPGFVMGEMVSRVVHGKLVYAMTFQSNAPTENLLNVVTLTSMDDEELLLYCATPLNEKTNIQFHIFTKVIESLVIEEAEKHDC